MKMIRTTIWSGVAVSIRMLSGLALNKILAVLVGPAGYAVLGQFQNAIQVCYTVAAGSLNNGITKYTAEYAGDPPKQAELWSTAVRLVIASWIVVGGGLIVFYRQLGMYFFGNGEYSTVFLWLSGSIGLFSLNTALLAIINGKKDIRTFVLSNIAGSVLILINMTVLAWFFGIYGALVALAVHQSLIFFVTVWLCRRMDWFNRARLLAPFSRPAALRLISFAAMAATAAIANNGGQFLVRLMIIDRYDLVHAGWWDAMIKLGQLNMLLVATTMAFYFIPRISELAYWEDIRQEIREGGKFLLPLFAAGALATYLLRDWFVLLLFTREFGPMRILFGWQLAGDTIRVASWFLAYVMIGKALIRTYVLTEILTNTLYVVLCWWFMRLVGFEGVVLAHFATYLAATAGMYVAVSRDPRLPRREASIK